MVKHLLKYCHKYWRESWAIARRILTELFRRKRSLIAWMIFPATILLLNGIITGGKQNNFTSQEAFEIAAPATLVGAALFFSCLGGGVATIVSEREQQTLKRLFLSPLSGVSYFLGTFLAHSVIGIGQTLVIFTIAFFAGAEFPDANWPIAVLIILLSILAYVGLGFMLGTQFARRTEDVSAIIAAFGVPLMVLGGAFLPIEIFPPSLLKIAKFNPIYHMTQALTQVLVHPEENLNSGGHFLFLTIFAGLMVGVGWLSYRQMLAAERQL
ncbi:MAG: ABC transporter permease [Phormidesmis sp.]